MAKKKRPPNRPEKPKDCCACCRFYKDDPDSEADRGFCRRYPRPIEVNREQWCGEYDKRKPPEN